MWRRQPRDLPGQKHDLGCAAPVRRGGHGPGDPVVRPDRSKGWPEARVSVAAASTHTGLLSREPPASAGWRARRRLAAQRGVFRGIDMRSALRRGFVLSLLVVSALTTAAAAQT